MRDIVDEIDRVHREVGTDGEARTVLVRRRYDAEPADVWDACTTPERVARWFYPVTGDFRVGGRYQLEGNAGGEIIACEPPTHLKLTWDFGGGTSQVEVRLAEDGDGTLLELLHTAVVPPAMWDEYGPGAVGVGWDLTLLGLGLHLETGEAKPDDADAFARSAEGAGFITASGRAWGDAHLAAGATARQAASTTEKTIAFYTP
ncbi:SRPBCC family protein [Streptosporangium sp. NBC_01639]|uniref:SRPBCC family protein n=1 Tax=Streptosporangium sp. NBC_01639 TaxID=2975948 RepID=UPI003867C6EE|nr:SRPBCC family protein [Streptosporangium sp. NBC_01639]